MSDSLDPVFRLPGMNFSLRKVLKLDSLEVRFNLIGKENSTSHISIEESDTNSDLGSTGGETLLEVFYQSWDKKLMLGQHAYHVWDPHWGLLTCSARWMDVGQVNDRFLSGGMGKGRMVVEEIVESADVEFSARIIWMFEEGRHTRRMEITKHAATLRRQLVYDPLRNGGEGIKEEIGGSPGALVYTIE